MRFLVVITTVLAFASAKPQYGKPNDDDVQVMVVSSNSQYAKMMGICRQKDFTYATVECQRALFLSFRINKTAPCEKRFQLFIRCNVDQLRKCYRNAVSEYELSTIINEQRSALELSRNIICGKEEFNVSQYLTDVPEMKDCPKPTIEDLGNCAKPWTDLFRKDKGSSKLCYKYYEYIRCSKRVIRRCKYDIPGMEWMFKQDLNPFCDKKQLWNRGLYAMASIHVGRSEEEVGEKVDRCLADGLIKTGAGAAIGVVFSVLFFKRKGWPVAFGIGTGTGMAIANCQHEFRRMFPGVSITSMDSKNEENIVTSAPELVEEKLTEDT